MGVGLPTSKDVVMAKLNNTKDTFTNTNNKL
jgi:hypothetical protein